MDNVLEVLMMVIFGCSWPVNLHKAWVAKTAKGTSVFFYILVVIGYLCGLGSKYIKYQNGNPAPLYVTIIYLINTIMVTLAIFVWVRNSILDASAESRRRKEAAAAPPPPPPPQN